MHPAGHANRVHTRSQRGPEVFMRKGKRTFASRKRKIAGLCALMLAGVLAVGAYAFTASNTQAEKSGAGANTAEVSGYKTSSLHFTQEAGGKVKEAEFTATANAGESEAKEAQIDLHPKVGAGTGWIKCVASGTGPVTFKCALGITNTEVEEFTEQETLVTS